MIPTDERRTFPRVRASIDATISGPSGRFDVRVVDISLGGMSVDSRGATLTEGSPPSAPGEVLFDGAMTSVEFETHASYSIRLFARVRWTSDGSRVFGVQFLDMGAPERDALIAFIDHLVRSNDTDPTPPPRDGA